MAKIVIIDYDKRTVLYTNDRWGKIRRMHHNASCRAFQSWYRWCTWLPYHKKLWLYVKRS